MTIQKTICSIALASALSVGGAHASTVLIDFTDTSLWSGKKATATTSVDYGMSVVSLTTNPADSLNFTQPFDGPGGSPGSAIYCDEGGGPLACLSDGLGILDDEITYIDIIANPPLQSVTVNFDKAVHVIGFHFLDLFVAADGSGDIEEALIYANGDPFSVTSYTAVEPFQQNGGYRFADSAFQKGLHVTSLTFFTGPGNDAQGNPDYSIAGIEVAAVPLPAALWLMLGALGGLGALRRFGTARA